MARTLINAADRRMADSRDSLSPVEYRSAIRVVVALNLNQSLVGQCFTSSSAYKQVGKISNLNIYEDRLWQSSISVVFKQGLCGGRVYHLVSSS